MAHAVPALETTRLLLTIPPASTAPRLAAYLLENREHYAASVPDVVFANLSEESCRARLETDRRDFEEDRSLRLVFFQGGTLDGAIVGECAFTAFVRGPFQACYLGYRLDAAYVGQGLMQEALGAAIRYVLDTLELHRIMANYRPTNERSGNLLRRLGFVVEGYARDYLFLDGAWRDHVLTSLTSSPRLPPG
jgi:ribosomal-protein-alanine N-acetyltransferase